MKKYIQSMMAFAAIVSFASCSSEDNNTTIENESATKVMTFTATQEGDEQSTRAAISSTESKVINWQEGDQISIFDGKTNNQFTLKNGAGTKSATFQGNAATAAKYTAVYPYQSEASYDTSNGKVTGITLKATQNATDNSFDKEAALMIAEGDNTTLTFKNVVGYVKVTPKFACSKIVLQAAGESEYLAGMCTLSYGDGKPSITFTSEQSTSITLSGNITANTAYYIAVPAVTLTAGWSISFTDNTGNVYTRTGSNSITFKRNIVINLGEFSRTDNNLKLTLTQNGIVPADKQVDMGVFEINGKNYRLIFAKSNLTKDGLAASESDYGDYFAWGATEPWYTSYSGENFQGWKPEHSSGYASGTAPAFSPEYTSEKDFEMSDDPARKILGCDWQIPTKAIWYAFVNNSSSKSWDSDRKGYTFTNNSQTLFLPAAGYVRAKYFNDYGSQGRYWSGTAYSSSYAYRLSFSDGKLKVSDIARSYGCSVRPVRLIPVD
ncbi:hypothetical protein [Prevotella sp. P4-119]|uniref:hypothetical protein n=1 Tax=Prevotella sp. P4-119 TaxID=2024218 RepID=UPI0013031424|nr:hypothetical protein [Prevotella sp. P4-119]